MTREAPDCTGLSENEARQRLFAAGYSVCVRYYEGFRRLNGADGFCVVCQRESKDAQDRPAIELTVCNFKRGIAEI